MIKRIAIVFLLLVGCADQPLRQGDSGVRSEEVKASYYSRSLAGRKTASGERYDPKRYTAAHRTLPLGTMVRVTRLPHGPSVNVKINDRCGCTHGREIDLSEAAARDLDMMRVGVVRVRIEVLSLPRARPGS